MIAFPTPPLPAEYMGQRLCEIFGRQRWDFIYAQSPKPNKPPDWKTEKRYKLKPRALYSGWKDPNYILGTRFEKETCYALLDIDISSPHHLRQDAEGIKKLQIALETIGIVRTIAVRSSWSEGLWLYIPLPELLPTFNLAVCIKSCLQAQGFDIKDGELEIFPNDKTFGLEIITLYKGHRLPLQPGTGSCLLDENLHPSSSLLEDFFAQWDSAAAGQDIATLKSALIVARENRKKKRKPKQVSDLEAWRRDLEFVIAEGWTGYGQTNGLLKEIGCYGVIFQGKSGEALVDFIRETAISSPGYRQYCRHQQEIVLRARSWARSVEKYYWPVGTHPKPRVNNVLLANQDSAEKAQARIRSAVEQLKADDRWPEQTTARLTAIRAISGCSPATLYKYASLWHPDHQPVINQPSRVTSPQKATLSPQDKEPEACDDKTLHPQSKTMKCLPPQRVSSFEKENKNSSPRGVRGEVVKSFPQVKGNRADSVPLPSERGLSSVSAIDASLELTLNGIRTQLQRLQWTVNQVIEFIKTHFDGKRRSQLSDDELLHLLYKLQSE